MFDWLIGINKNMMQIQKACNLIGLLYKNDTCYIIIALNNIRWWFNKIGLINIICKIIVERKIGTPIYFKEIVTPNCSCKNVFPKKVVEEKNPHIEVCPKKRCWIKKSLI